MLTPQQRTEFEPQTSADTEFPIVRHPAVEVELPVIVAIPHYGTLALPQVDVTDYAQPHFQHFAMGFADPFAAQLYGGLHASGATVIASPYSRLFIDLNRARDDFETAQDTVHSNRGVVRTHTLSGIPVFKDELSATHTEARLQRYYDPYHTRLAELVTLKRHRAKRLTLVDAHSALARRFGDREIIISTQRGQTARPDVAETAAMSFREAGFRVDFDVPGYAGGHTVRQYGRGANTGVDAIQIEVGVAVLSETPRDEFIATVKEGRHPQANASTLVTLQGALGVAIKRLAEL